MVSMPICKYQITSKKKLAFIFERFLLSLQRSHSIVLVFIISITTSIKCSHIMSSISRIFFIIFSSFSKEEQQFRLHDCLRLVVHTSFFKLPYKSAQQIWSNPNIWVVSQSHFFSTSNVQKIFTFCYTCFSNDTSKSSQGVRCDSLSINSRSELYFNGDFQNMSN